MEEILLRVCVVLVSLVCLKDKTVFEEQDDIIMDMQEWDYVLQKEGAKLEQEVHSVAVEPSQVSQSHRRLTKGEDEESDVQQILPNGYVESSHEHQMPQREDQNILHHKLLTEDNQDELPTDKTVDKVLEQSPNVDHADLLPDKFLSPKEGIQSDIVPSGQNETKPKGNEKVSQEDGESLYKKEDPHLVNDMEAPSGESSHLHQTGPADKQVSSEEVTEIPQEEHKSFFQQTVYGFIHRWFQTSQEVHTSLENESLEGSKQLQMQVMQKGEKITQIDESMSKVDQGDSQTAEGLPHADQKPSNPSQEQTKALQGEHFKSENAYTWYLWKVLSLMSVIRLLRKFIGRNSGTSGSTSPIMKGKKLSGTINISLLDHKVLSCFYEECVQIPPNTRERVCDFVEGFVDELLEAARVTSNKGNDMQIGDFVGIGSLYELWATGKTVVCDLYVPITAPKSYSFDFELDMPACGRIKLVKAENTSNGCPCNDGMMDDDDDMLCLIHPHKETSSVITDAVDGPLCQENTPYLAKTQVIKWFRKTFSKAWGENSHKYEFELAFRNQAAPGALRVRLRSGQVILFNITPVVQVKGSDIYLVSYLPNQCSFSDTHWPISLASYENALLKHFTKSLPYDSCHIQCLQILSFLHKQQIQLTGKCWLTSYHLKITLLHLLFTTNPLEWKSEQLAGRLTDMLIFLDQRLEARNFYHSLVGNPLVPSIIGLPKEVKLAKPTNIFQPLVSDRKLYLKTVQHLQELVKNAPVLIHEYVSVKCRES
ncbi:inositol 1,4,5-trisphosphate receptor-interacting protein [Colossoma macropomum]|uniref:inositol 1,4,5-trisphosphate receptor-interacting protein n=1 Tax=Colossoma macropomum TaxID=42526 RepID=UPI0018648DB5|nr:inositol 1,4,5-trisphosphate receptor-interacting protein [Colossoma macropomum]